MLIGSESQAVVKDAFFSEDRKHRYGLMRSWDMSKPAVLFVCLNPSTADETVDDPTIRRCIAFAKDWGFGTVFVVNIFSFRATDPKRMKAEPEPTGPLNDGLLQWFSHDVCTLTIAAWGQHGSHLQRDEAVLKLLKNPHHLGLTKDGQPRHPLYLPKTTKPTLLR